MAKIIFLGWSVLVVFFFHILSQKISLRAYEEIKSDSAISKKSDIEWEKINAQVKGIIDKTKRFKDYEVYKAEF